MTHPLRMKSTPRFPEAQIRPRPGSSRSSGSRKWSKLYFPRLFPRQNLARASRGLGEGGREPGTPCRGSLAGGGRLRGSLSRVHPLPPLWKQEGASNLLNLCVDKLSRSAEEDYPELICLFKLVVVIVTSLLPSSSILSLVPSSGFVDSGPFSSGLGSPFVGENCGPGCLWCSLFW